jgi:hypothetical protein
MQTSRLQRSALFFAAATFAVAACGTSAQTPATVASGSGSAAPSTASPQATPISSAAIPDAAVYAEIEAQIEALRKLQHKSPVSPVLLNEQGVREWLTKANAAQTDHAALANQSKLLINMGLLPPGSSLEKLQLDLLVGQVAGFYDPESKGLYVVSSSGKVGAFEKMTFSHEYTHALQDQVFGLDKLANGTADQGDRNLARTALAEGDATLAMTQWSLANITPEELMALANMPGTGAALEQMAKAPKILRESLLFPYQDGLTFVQGIYDAGGWDAVDRLYANPPDSTSQILHPAQYTNKVKPMPVSIPAVPRSLSGWKLTMQDTLGELQLRIWLERETAEANSNEVAKKAVAEWGGDRVGLYEGPNGEWAVVIHTVWRSSSGRDAFSAAATATLESMGADYRACGDSTHVEIAFSSDDAAVPELIDCNTMG